MSDDEPDDGPTGGTDGTATGGRRWRLSSWLYLVYLVVPFLQPLFDPTAGAADWLLAAGVVTAFLPLYVAAELRPDRLRVCVVATTVLGIATTPFNTGASVLFVYAAAFTALVESRRTTLRVLAGLTALTGLSGVVSMVPLPWRLLGIGPSVVFIWIIGLVQLDDARRRRDADELRLRNARIEHLATVSERERLARDLHDLLGHSLTAVVMRAQLVRHLTATDPDRARTEAAEIENTAREALAEIRGTLGGWRRATLDDELEAGRATLTSLGVELVERRCPGLVLVGSTEHALALALREALTNVARHAGARTCQVVVDTVDGELRLVIADDGVGGRSPDGHGLSGIRERIGALGGTVHRDGGAGTTVTISVPLEVAT
ncbi:sensor histidine kinase [Saccharomonospora iraqiensis]|uniref:sensor histidine kinase n=1 Tax=Saccharomonospora iraqiensis TaxID=52698 RepID=UPI00022E2024|nr:histidine kinase [Saccharomonospora iraqiensis]